MREITKSLTTYTWAMMAFGVQQTFNLLSPNSWAPGGRATQGLKNVTDATVDELGDTLKATFRVGDNLQRGMVDLMFTAFSLGMFDPGGVARRGADGQPAPDPAGRATRGCAGATCTDAGPQWSSDAGSRRDPSRDARTDSSTSQAEAHQPASGWGPMPR